MKTLIFSSFIFIALSFSAVDDSPLSQLLTRYYEIKNALVKGDANEAASKAAEFVKAINSVDMNTLMPLKEKLVVDAKHISEAKDISRQREYFQSFSNNFYQLAKAVKLSDQPVYQDYCPMKKAYWLSSEAVIKNPYFGAQMLTCGKVTDTIK